MKRQHIIIALTTLSFSILLTAPLLGKDIISPSVLYSGSAIDRKILLSIRLPRVLMAFLAGSMLALSGMSFQALFRNPLATPFTLGVSSGAALGAALFIRTGFIFSILGISGVSIAAFTGAILAVALVYALTRIKGGFSTATLLLAGIAISFFFSSVILFIQYISGQSHSFRIMRWLMGSISSADTRRLYNILPFAITGTCISILLKRELNLLMAGEDIAISRGVNVSLIRKMVFFSASLMVGGVVAVCGPIGFVGMMSPHICRMIVGSDHRYLSPATFLLGGIFLVICDTLARTLIAPAEIPVGVITALLGGPFFIWLLMKKSD